VSGQVKMPPASHKKSLCSATKPLIEEIHPHGLVERAKGLAIARDLMSSP